MVYFPAFYNFEWPKDKNIVYIYVYMYIYIYTYVDLMLATCMHGPLGKLASILPAKHVCIHFLNVFWHEMIRPWLKKSWHLWRIVLNSCQNPLLNLRTCTSLLGPMKLEVKDFSHHIVVTIWPRTWKTCQPHGAVWRVKILTSLWFQTWYRKILETVNCPPRTSEM